MLSITVAASPKSALNYQHFAHLPLISNVTVSPDGKHIAAIYQAESGPAVVVSKFGSQDISVVAKLDKDRDRLDQVTWSGPKRLIIESSISQRQNKDYWRKSFYYAVNIDGSNLLQIMPQPIAIGTKWEKQAGTRVRLISNLPTDQDHILVQVFDARDKAQSVFKVNILNNEFEKQFINKYNVDSWFVDSKGRVTLGIGVKENEPEMLQYWYRKDGEGEWALINEYRNMSGDTFTPLLIQNEKLWVLSDRELNRDAIWEFDPQTAKFGDLVYSHPKYDVSRVVMNGDRTRAIGVSYTEHFQETHYFNGNDTSVNTIVANSFPNYETVIGSRDLSSQKLMIIAYKNDSPAKYFWLDLAEGKAGFWFSQYPYLEGQQLGKTEPFDYTARDGMQLHGYLTMPVNVQAGKKPPLVVLPHGGPFGPRDDQSFDYLVQFLANLGYAVVQPNFRGSGGYGSVYQTAGYKQWGLAMQNDVYDSVEWLKSQGKVDTSNACVVGWSYGGYVGLTASYQQPDAFKCIVSIAGVSDIERHARENSLRRSALSEFTKQAIGDISISADAKQLENASAINFLDKIKAPILLIHGRKDTQVHFNQSSDFYEAADDAGVDIDYIEYETGTHYLDEYNNRLDAFKHIEKFLKKHLKAK